MAGDSADEVARRAREKAARLLRNAEMWEKGAAGERAVEAILATLPPEWTSFHDLRWPGRPRANIDHLVIGPGGLFVIDAKNWSGPLEIRGAGLRHIGRSRDSTVEAAQEAAVAIASLVPALPPSFMTPVLCFTGEASVDGSIAGVALCSSSRLTEFLLGRPQTLSPEWLAYLSFELGRSTRSATGPAAPLFPQDRPGFVAAASSKAGATRPSRAGARRKPRRRKSGSGVARQVAVAAIGLVALGSYLKGLHPATVASTSGSHSGVVTYRVTTTGPATARVVSWNEGRRGTMKVTGARLPWTHTVRTTDFAVAAYVLTAQLNGAGTITCEIDAPATPVQRHSATGLNVVVECM